MSAADEDAVVAAVVALAETATARDLEQFDRVGVAAYQALAESRGVALEDVLRAACRGRLRDVVTMPTVKHSTGRTPK